MFRCPYPGMRRSAIGIEFGFAYFINLWIGNYPQKVLQVVCYILHNLHPLPVSLSNTLHS